MAADTSNGRSTRSIIQYALLALVVLVVMEVVSFPMPRGDIDRSDAEAYYREMLDVIKSRDRRRWCGMTAHGFKGYFRARGGHLTDEVEFNSAKYCRGSGRDVPAAMIFDHDEIELISIKPGPGGLSATLEYVARYRIDGKLIETTFIDKIESVLGSIKVRERWVFEEESALP